MRTSDIWYKTARNADKSNSKIFINGPFLWSYCIGMNLYNWCNLTDVLKASVINLLLVIKIETAGE